MNIEFKETQTFTQWWLWLLLAGLSVIPVMGIYKQLILGEPFGNSPMSDLGLILFSAFVFSLIVLFWVMNLKTEIDQHEIRIQFFPLFVKKQVKWQDVKYAEILNYGFVGGWGIRFWTKYGTVYNTKGNKGLAIELNDGKKFLIGTQKETELQRVLEKILNNRKLSFVPNNKNQKEPR